MDISTIDGILSSLPRFNGSEEYGIAAGVDLSIADKIKLRVPVNISDLRTRATVAAVSVYFNNEFGPKYIGIYTAAAYAIVGYSLAAENDGDSLGYEIGKMRDVTEDELDVIKSYLSSDWIKKGLLAVIATKLNWWSTNHHTGTPEITGYARKVALTTLGAKTDELREVAEVMHTVGHWASTKMVLHVLGVKHIEVMSLRPYGGNALVGFQVSDDVKLRVSGFPAGTHRTAIAYAALSRLKGHFMLRYSPVIMSSLGIIHNAQMIKKDPAFYHIGAHYLTGSKDPNFSDSEAATVLGRLTTFIKYFFSNSTLASSPHMRVGNAWKDKNYEDYSSEYDHMCASVSAELARGDTVLGEALTKRTAIDETGLSEEAVSAFLEELESPMRRKRDIEQAGFVEESSDESTISKRLSTATIAGEAAQTSGEFKKLTAGEYANLTKAQKKAYNDEYKRYTDSLKFARSDV